MALWVTISLACAAIIAAVVVRWALRPRKSYHVFISYRVASDAALARRVCRQLQGREVETGVALHCYLDQKDIESGTDWEKSFMTGLSRSCVYLPLVSDPGACMRVSPSGDCCCCVRVQLMHTFNLP